jgi:GNAT superfamily N-acetyltransferase
MEFREATENDLSALVALLADDKLGRKREDFQIPLPTEYLKAYQRIKADENQQLIVAVKSNDEVVGTLQLTFIPYLTYRGGIRAQIEGVRIKSTERGQGLGRQLIEWAIDRAKERDAHLIQLTTDTQRPDAIKFYEDLGFKPSHVGMKLHFK